MDRGSLAGRIWYETSVPVFLERYLLPVAATLTVLVVFLNTMSFDWTQRITGGVALCFAAYFVSHTVHKLNNPPKPITSSEVVQRVVKSRAEELRSPAAAPTPSVKPPEMEHPQKEPTKKHAGSSEPPPVPRAQKGGDSIPNNDRSVKIGDGNQFSNSPIVTGDHATVEIRTGPTKPFILTPQGKQKMAEILSGYADGQIELVCIGRGCQSMDSIAAAFASGGWRFETTQIGQYVSVGSPVDISSGVHVLDNRTSRVAGDVLRKALLAVGLKFDDAPWQSSHNPKIGLCLVIGNPE